MFDIIIVTAEKTLFEASVKMAVVPTVTGGVGILTNHHPMTAQLDIGPLRLTKEDDSEVTLFIAGGFLEMNNNKLTILADTAENLEEIELDKAIEARQKAETLVKTAPNEAEVERLLEEVKMHSMREKLANIHRYSKNQN